MKSILLTRGCYARVDDADFAWLMQFRWMCSTSGYAIRAYRDEALSYDADGQARWRFVHMHRVIMAAQPGQLVDHIDGDRLNNTRANLRIVTPSQNAWNAHRRCDNAVGYKGVSQHPRGYLARIRFHRQRIHLGYFDDARDAALMYDAAAIYLFGEFAKLNLPDTPTPQPCLEQLERVLARWSTRIDALIRQNPASHDL